MNKTGWKALAIIFIILFALETISVIWLWDYGTDLIEKENECIYNVCDEYDAYIYDDVESICYCYKDNEIVYHEFIR